MKIATIVVRLLLGGMMLFASISYFFGLIDQPKPTGDLATLMAGFVASKYIFPVAKTVELISGITLVTGKFMKIGTIILLAMLSCQARCRQTQAPRRLCFFRTSNARPAARN